jgi:hypothetical protein
MPAHDLPEPSATTALIRMLIGHGHAALSPADWSEILAAARHLGLSGRLAARLEPQEACLPLKVRDHLEAARRIAAKHRRTLAWEIDRVGAALASLEVPVVLLKGAAYLARELPPSAGRLASDIDILVPRDQISTVETALLRAGWEEMQPDAYDQRYVRDWMHEIPPLRHVLRNTVLDVHHTILPPTSRYNRALDPTRLFEAATPLDRGGLATLSPVDMVLHSATHRFTEGEHPRGLRDLIDIHELIGQFTATDADFCQRLVDRAERLGLERPLYYAIRYCRLLFATRIPCEAARRIEAHAPAQPIRMLMDAIVPRAFLGLEPTAGSRLASELLYIRGHYLRMPLPLLIPHLVRKSIWRRLRETAESATDAR